MMEDDRLDLVLNKVREVIIVWEDRRRQFSDAVTKGDTTVLQAEAGLGRALRGMPLSRWKALSTGKDSPRTAQVARDLHQVAGSRQHVEAAMKTVAAAEATRDAQVRHAIVQFAEVGGQLAGHGRLAERFTGLQREELFLTSRTNRWASGRSARHSVVGPTNWGL